MEEVQKPSLKYTEKDLPFCIGMKCRFMYNGVTLNGVINDTDGFLVNMGSAVYSTCVVFAEDIETIPEYDKYRNSKLFKLMYD